MRHSNLAFACLVAGLANVAFADPEQRTGTTFEPRAATGGDVVSLPAIGSEDFGRNPRLSLVEIDPITDRVIGRRRRVARRRTVDDTLAFRVRRVPPGRYGLLVRTRGEDDVLLTGGMTIAGPRLGELSAVPVELGGVVTLPGVYPLRRGLRVRLGGTRARITTKSREAISFVVPKGLVPGSHEVVVKSRTGSSIASALLQVEGLQHGLYDGPGKPHGFVGDWLPGEPLRRLAVDAEVRGEELRVTSQSSVWMDNERHTAVELRVPVDVLDLNLGVRSRPATTLVVRGTRVNPADPRGPLLVDTWYGADTASVRLNGYEETVAGFSYRLAFTGLVPRVNQLGEAAPGAPLRVKDGIVTLFLPRFTPPPSNALARVEFVSGDGRADLTLTTGSYGDVVAESASPLLSEPGESVVYSRFLELGGPDPRGFDMGTQGLRVHWKTALLVEAQFTRAMPEPNPVRGGDPELGAIGPDQSTTDEALTSPWYPITASQGLASGDPLPSWFPAFDRSIYGTTVRFDTPTDEIETRGYGLVRYRVRFFMSAGWTPEDGLPSLDAVSTRYEVGGR